MTRKEIIEAIDFELDPPTFAGGTWTTDDLENAMVAAYNRAIDDAVKVCYSPTVEGTVLDDLESLKIK